MSRILIIAEHDGATLSPSVAKTVACAAEISDAEIDVLILADTAEPVAAAAAKLDGVQRVLTIENPANSTPLAAILAPQIVAAADGYSHVFGPSSTFGRDLMPRVAALLVP